MAIIQNYPNELDYVNAMQRRFGPSSSFLDAFFDACLRADAENYELLRPVLQAFMGKYPARAELLERERRDREVASD